MDDTFDYFLPETTSIIILGRLILEKAQSLPVTFTVNLLLTAYIRIFTAFYQKIIKVVFFSRFYLELIPYVRIGRKFTPYSLI